MYSLKAHNLTQTKCRRLAAVTLTSLALIAMLFLMGSQPAQALEADTELTPAADNDAPVGIWGNAETVWVVDDIDDKIYAYNRSNLSPDSGQDFDTLSAAGNEAPWGIWSDGTTMFVVDIADERIYAYRISTKARDPDKDITLDGDNDEATDIWGNADHMWVANSSVSDSGDKIFAYRRSDGTHEPDQDFDNLDEAGNNETGGIWSDGTTMYVADPSDDKVYVYRMSDKSHDSGKDFTLDMDNGAPTGLWAYSNRLYVTDRVDGKLYTYTVNTFRTPPKPKNFRTTRVTQTSITLQWYVVKDADGYILEYQKDGETGGWTRVDGYFDHLPSQSRGHRPIAVAAGLDCNTKYNFRLSAHHPDPVYKANGGASPYVQTNGRTGECPTSDRITNLLVTLEPNQASLSWTAPAPATKEIWSAQMTVGVYTDQDQDEEIGYQSNPLSQGPDQLGSLSTTTFTRQGQDYTVHGLSWFYGELYLFTDRQLPTPFALNYGGNTSLSSSDTTDSGTLRGYRYHLWAVLDSPWSDGQTVDVSLEEEVPAAGYRITRKTWDMDTETREISNATETVVAENVAHTGDQFQTYRDTSSGAGEDDKAYAYFVEALNAGGEPYGLANTDILRGGSRTAPEPVRNARLTHDTASRRSMAWEAPPDPWLTTVYAAREGEMGNSAVTDPWRTTYRVERREFEWLDPVDREWYVPQRLDVDTFWTATMTVGGPSSSSGFTEGNYGQLSQASFSFQGVSYTVDKLVFFPSTNAVINLVLDPALPSGDTADWVLEVGRTQVPFTGAGYNTTSDGKLEVDLRWNSTGSSAAVPWTADDTVPVQLKKTEPNDWEILRQAGSSTSRSYTDNQHTGGNKFYVYRITAHNSQGLSYQDWIDDWLFDSPLHMLPGEAPEGSTGGQVNPGTGGGQGGQGSSQEGQTPTVSAVAVTSDPGPDSTYIIGDALQVSATFSEAVTVSGQPQLALSIGDESETAAYHGGSGTTTLVFTYNVREGDHGGVVIGADAIDLNGGSINASSGGNAATLSHAIHTANHIVDARRPAMQSAAVDGATLTLTYSKTLDGTSTPATSAFRVAVGNAHWSVTDVSVSGRTVTLTLVSAVASDNAVSVNYTVPTGDSANPVRDLLGNAASPFSGRAVTNNTASSGQAVQPPAVSSLTITSDPGTDNFYGIGEGITFTATFDEAVTVTGSPQLALTLNDAPKTAYAQAASNTTTVYFTYTVVENDQGGVAIGSDAITLNGGSINSADDADQAADLSHDGQSSSHRVDGVRPALTAATVDGAALTLTFSEVLDGDSEPPASAFPVSAAGETRAVSGASVSGNTVALTLASAVTHGETVTVGYTQPTGNSPTPVRDQAGNNAPSFSGQAVTNNTEAASDPPPDPEPGETDPEEPQDPLTASVHGVPGSHDGENVFTIELRFSEELESGFSFKVLRDHAFTVTGGEITKAKRVAGSGNTRFTIHVQPEDTGGVAVILAATTDCEAAHAICTGDGRPLSNGLNITVSGP